MYSIISPIRHTLSRIIFVFILISSPGILQGQNISKALLITGNGNLPKAMDGYPGWVHEFHNNRVSEILSQVITVDTTSDLSTLNSKFLADYNLIISNSLFLNANEEQLASLYQFVSEGKSFLTLHCGILSFLNWNKYEDFIGGIFIGGPSTEPETFKVYTTNDEFWGFKYKFRQREEHPVSAVVDDFFIKDELYYFQPSTKNFHVIARAENHPVMWWHPVGKGKVMSLTLGHSEEAKKNLGYQELLRNGVRWLLNYSLIRTPDTLNVSNRKNSYRNFLDIKDANDNIQDNSLSYSILNQDGRLSVSNKGGSFDLLLNGGTGLASFDIAAINTKNRHTIKKIHVNIINDGNGNIAQYFGNSVSGTSSENNSKMFDISNIIDGDLESRWSSKETDTSIVVIDLTKVYAIKTVKILWEASYATQYDLMLSLDGKKWITPKFILNRSNLNDQVQFTSANARYVKLELNEKVKGKRGYSIYEIQIFN